MNPIRPPSRRLQPSEGEARAIHEGVGHEETHRQERGHQVEFADEHQQSGHQVCEEQSASWLSFFRQGRQWLEHRQDVVASNLLQQPWCHNEALQRLAQGSDDDTDECRLGERIPNDVLDNGPPNIEMRGLAFQVLVAAMDVALKVAVVSNAAPKYEERHVHEEAEDDGCEGPVLDVLRWVLEHVRAVGATQDPCEARIKQRQHCSEAVVPVIVRAPICFEVGHAQSSQPLVASLLMWRREEPKVEGEKGVEHNDDKEKAQLRHNVDASPDRQREARQEGRADGLHVPGELGLGHGHGEGLHRAEALQHSEHRDRQPVHDPDGCTDHWP
mmetsp:Transcript_49423/g.130325  ORF Transcript_49423/g.130325 Transcript_49423/m.130325 type:complete len:329 (+) Transcript_49423:1991-2977(+)